MAEPLELAKRINGLDPGVNQREMLALGDAAVYSMADVDALKNYVIRREEGVVPILHVEENGRWYSCGDCAGGPLEIWANFCPHCGAKVRRES